MTRRDPSPPTALSPVPGRLSLVFIVSVLIGLSLQPVLAQECARDRALPARQIEQIRCLAQSIVRVATQAARTDRQLPLIGSLRPDAARSAVPAAPLARSPVTGPHAIDLVAREALHNTPPPRV